MDLTITNNAINQIRQIFSSRTPTRPCIETEPMKKPFEPAPIDQPFPRVEPESAGVSSELLAEYYAALRDDPDMDMHSVTVLRRGQVLAEASFGAYDRSVWHISYSECKSVVGLAVGMLVDEGRLNIDDKLVKLFGDRVPKLAYITMKDLTVRHLLTMTSGVVFNEAASVTEEDWVRGFFESLLRGEPGVTFNYNSMNTYMLSALVCHISGETLTQFLQPRLFQPLGITRVFWETCPRGIEKGGWGLYMRQEDFAKIGQLVLNRGLWNGKRLISAQWIDAATSPQSHPPVSYGDYDYGYQIWVGRHQRSFLFSGMFGQNVLGWFDTGVLLVSNAGNDELFQQSSFFPLTHRALGRAFSETLPENRAACDRLRALLRSLAFNPEPEKRGLFGVKKETLPPMARELAGRLYAVTSPNAPSLGLLPLAVQALQNIYSKGLLSLSFRIADDKLRMTVSEADCAYDVAIGFSAPEYAVPDFHGEPHRVAVTGRFAKNEDDEDVLVIRVSFLETASARHIRLYFSKDRRSLRGRWTETPGAGFLRQFVDDTKEDLSQNPVISGLINGVAAELIDFKISGAFEPTITAKEA